MIRLAWHTVRARKAGLIGTFIALALGVALLSVMALTLASTPLTVYCAAPRPVSTVIRSPGRCDVGALSTTSESVRGGPPATHE